MASSSAAAGTRYNLPGARLNIAERDQVVNNINDSTITTGSYNTHNYNYARSGDLEILSKHVAFNAFYNSGQRHPQPRCHPGTRETILARIYSWVERNFESMSTEVFWLYGAAGVGKSAIAQTVCEKYTQNNILAADFFFSRNDPSRDNLHSFIPSIAYRLATSESFNGVLRHSIDRNSSMDHHLMKLDVETQFERLLKQPCATVDAELWKTLPRLVVIDGLDECTDVPSQERLLELVRKTAKDSSIPFFFLICSRPELRIKDAFDHDEFTDNLDSLGIGRSSYESDGDIERFLRHEFSNIAKRHRRLMPEADSTWPGDMAIQNLVRRADGQFIFAVTVIRFIAMTVSGEELLSPQSRLQIVLNLKVEGISSSPYPDLDSLYSEILKHCPWEHNMFRKVLQLIMTKYTIPKNVPWAPSQSFPPPQPSSGWRSTNDIAYILSITPSYVELLVRKLHSVLDIPDSHTLDITSRHASFLEYLSDPLRSKDFHLDSLKTEEHHALIGLRMIIQVHGPVRHGDIYDMSARLHWQSCCWSAMAHWEKEEVWQDLVPMFETLDPFVLFRCQLPELYHSELLWRISTLHRLYLLAKRHGSKQFRCVAKWESFLHHGFVLYISDAGRDKWDVRTLALALVRLSMAFASLRHLLRVDDFHAFDYFFESGPPFFLNDMHITYKRSIFGEGEVLPFDENKDLWVEVEALDVAAEDLSTPHRIRSTLERQYNLVRKQLLEKRIAGSYDLVLQMEGLD